jgi:hypothetical protein
MSTAKNEWQTCPAWEDVQEALREHFNRHYPTAWNGWFQPVTGGIEEEENSTFLLRLEAPSKFHAQWIRDNYLPVIESIWRQFAPQGKIIFEVQLKPEKQSKALQPKAKVVQLDFWEDEKRAAPNAFLRSALFPVLDPKKERQFLKEQKLCSVSGINVIFTGQQFDQSDLDVYLELLQLARPFPLGTPLKFSAYTLLKALGRHTGNSDYKWLHSVLIRLRGGTLDLTDHQKKYFGGLIEGGFRDEFSHEYEITINPKFAVLFGFGMWATIDRAQRTALGRHTTAKALHAYYSTHAAPSAHNFETLAKIVGLNNPSGKRVTKARIIKAHELLKNIGFLKDYEVSEESIKAHINHTPRQNKHIAGKIINERKK